MELKATTLDNSTKLIALSGRMDLQGVDKIDLDLTRQTTLEKGNIIIDLSGVSFMASIGLRSIMTCARSQKIKGGKIVLASPSDLVADLLKTTAIDTVIEIFPSIEDAEKSFSTS